MRPSKADVVRRIASDIGHDTTKRAKRIYAAIWRYLDRQGVEDILPSYIDAVWVESGISKDSPELTYANAEYALPGDLEYLIPEYPSW